MKYYVNPSFSVDRIDEEKLIVVCNDYLREYECEIEILQTILGIIKTSGRIEDVYSRYENEYTREEIEEFLTVLLQEGVIFTETVEYTVCKLAVLGNEENFSFLNNIVNEETKLFHFKEVSDYINSNEKFAGLIWLPAEMTYGEAVEINRELVKKELPFAICRFNGESMIAGPLVFPWKTPCVECHIQQHISLLNRDIENRLTMDNMRNLFYAKKWDNSFSDSEKISLLQVVLDDMRNVEKEKSNFSLYRKEIVVPRGKVYQPLIKNYQSTSECTCCRNINKAYLRDVTKINVPKLDNPLDGTEIMYKVGGLRSKTPEATEELVKNTLEKLDLDIKIEIDTTNPFAGIIPVYHSTLEMTHKNKTPYFFGEQHSHGKGLNKRQAYFSASFEMFERLSARYFGEKELVCGSYNQLKDYCADVSGMTKVVEQVNTVYDQFEADKEVDWVWAYSLTDHKPKLVPASLVFLSRSSFKGNFAPVGSSGMSAGATVKDAVLQGMFELLEHDAWMIGQANTVRLPIIGYRGLKNESLKNVISGIEEKGFHIISRDYTNDIGIPVIRTWISNPNDYANYAFSGFGASINPELALERSITEAVQSRASVHEADVEEYASLDMEYLISARDGLYSLFYFQQKDIVPIGDRKDITEMKNMSFETVDQSIEYVISRIKAVQPDADILFVDLTRKGIGIPVVKVIITKGTQLMGEPLLVASERLFEFQRSMGYSDKRPDYKELYLAPYPH